MFLSSRIPDQTYQMTGETGPIPMGAQIGKIKRISLVERLIEDQEGNPRETKGIELSKREERKAKGGLRIERGFGYGFRLLPRYEMATQQLHGFGGLFFFFFFILVISPPLYLFLEIFF